MPSPQPVIVDIWYSLLVLPHYTTLFFMRSIQENNPNTSLQGRVISKYSSPSLLSSADSNKEVPASINILKNEHPDHVTKIFHFCDVSGILCNNRSSLFSIISSSIFCELSAEDGRKECRHNIHHENDTVHDTSGQQEPRSFNKISRILLCCNLGHAREMPISDQCYHYQLHPMP